MGCLAPAFWLGRGLAHLFEAAVEYKYFEDRRVLFYLIGTTVSARFSSNYRLPYAVQHIDKTLLRSTSEVFTLLQVFVIRHRTPLADGAKDL